MQIIAKMEPMLPFTLSTKWCMKIKLLTTTYYIYTHPPRQHSFQCSINMFNGWYLVSCIYTVIINNIFLIIIRNINKFSARFNCNIYAVLWIIDWTVKNMLRQLCIFWLHAIYTKYIDKHGKIFVVHFPSKLCLLW